VTGDRADPVAGATATVAVTDVVTAVRCPRQYVLAREGRRVVPAGGAALGQIRVLVGVNLLLGIANLAVAVLGPGVH